MLKAEGLIPAARSSGHFTLRASTGHIQGTGRDETGGTGQEEKENHLVVGGWVG